MEKDEDVKNPALPDDYKHLEEPLKDAQKKIDTINHTIENLPNDKGPTLTYSRPGAGGSDRPVTREQKISLFERQKGEIKKQFTQLMDQELSSANAKTAQQVREIAEFRLSDNTFKGADKGELKNFKEASKEAEQSMDYMSSLHYSQFIEQPDFEDQTRAKGETIDDWNERFLALLEPSSGIEDNFPGKDHEKDDFDPTKE
jgi:hypothetical protein